MPFFSLARYPSRFPGSPLLDIQRDPLGTFGRMAATGAALVEAETGLRPFYLVTDPELAQELLTTPSDAFVKSPILRRTKVVLGDGLLTSEDPLHKRHRRLVLPAFHHARLRVYADTFVDLTERATAQWHDGEVFALDRAFARLTLDIATQTLFGTHVDLAAVRIHRALDAAMRVFRRRMMNPLAEWLTRLPLPETLRLRRARADLDRVVYDLIEARRAEPPATRAARTDLLSLLLDTRDEDDHALGDDEVRDEVMTLLLAGHETTANALTWTAVLLAEHPDVEARLHAEVDAVLGDRRAGFDDLRDLPFTRQVFSEALRLRPPAWAVSRQATRDTVLGGHRIPAGAVVTVSPYVLHHDARLWSRPDTFDPDRFAPDADVKRHKFAFLPFSAGRRGCIGEQFAWAEGVLVTATIAQRWRLGRADADPIPLHPSVTLRPGRPVLAIARRRSSGDQPERQPSASEPEASKTEAA